MNNSYSLPTSSGLFFIPFILVAGYIFISNYTVTKGRIARTNGQHLYLKSAVWGLSFLLFSFMISDWSPFSYWGWGWDWIPFTSDTFFLIQLPGYLSQEIFLAITSIEISITLLTCLQTPIWISNKMGGSADKFLYTILSNGLPFPFTISIHCRRLFFTSAYTDFSWLIHVWLTHASYHIIAVINYHMSRLNDLIIIIQLASHLITKSKELKSLSNQQIDIMLWQSLSDNADSILIICIENKKVFIGFSASLPDPAYATPEQTILFHSMMSGFLCEEFNNLHITEDLVQEYAKVGSEEFNNLNTTEDIDQEHAEVGNEEFNNLNTTEDIDQEHAEVGNEASDIPDWWDVSQTALHTSNIMYIRKYNLMEFLDSIESNEICPCGRDMYLPMPDRMTVKIQTENK